MTNSFAPDSSHSPRILVVSVRGFRLQVANCGLYEFEDLLCQLEGADLYIPSRELALPKKIYRNTKYITGSDFLADLLASFPKQLTLKREYDLLFAILDSPWQMHLLNTIAGWQKKCRHTACYITEMWPPDFNQSQLFKEPWQHFERIFLGAANCTRKLSEIINLPVTYLAYGIDALAFSPYPNPPQRSLDVCYVGRRVPQIHASLYQHCQETNFFYYYDTVQKQTTENFQEHRAKLINLLQRTRYHITYYAKFDQPQQTGSTQEIGQRFFEGAAAGTVMLGIPPAGEAFPRYFDWEDAVIRVELREKDVIEAIAELDKQPERLDKIRRQNVANSLLKHDWLYRWREILAAFDLQPTPVLLAREKLLQKLAEDIYVR